MPKGAGTPKGKSPAPRSRLPCGRWRSEAVSPREVFSVVEVAALVFFVQRHLPKTIAAGGRPGLGYSLRERRQLWGKVRRAMYRESGVRRTYQQATHRWSDILDREQDLLDLLGVEIPGLAPPRGKQAEGAAPAEQDATTLDRSVEGSSAGPSVTPSAQPTTTSAGASGEAPSTLGADAAEPPTPVPSGSAAGDVSGVAGGDTPSKPTRKELAIRARRRKLEAIAVEYRRLVAQADAEEEAAAAVSSSSVPGSTSSPRRRPLGVRRRGPAAARHRRGTSTPTPSHTIRILKERVRRLTLRVDHHQKELKALRKELRRVRDLSRGGHRRRHK